MQLTAGIGLLLLLLLQGATCQPLTADDGHAACKKYVHTIFLVCHVTVYHLGELPDMQALDNNERSRRALQPLLCPCPQGSVSWFCPSAVYAALTHFQHDALCQGLL